MVGEVDGLGRVAVGRGGSEWLWAVGGGVERSLGQDPGLELATHVAPPGMLW